MVIFFKVNGQKVPKFSIKVHTSYSVNFSSKNKQKGLEKQMNRPFILNELTPKPNDQEDLGLDIIAYREPEYKKMVDSLSRVWQRWQLM